MLSKRGFSIGIGDLDLSQESEDEIKKVIDAAEQESIKMIEKYHAGKIEPLPGRSAEETI